MVDPLGQQGTLAEVVFTPTIIGLLINVGVGGVVNAVFGALLNGETQINQILYNLGVGGLLGLVGGASASIIKTATTAIGKKLGLFLVAKLLYIAGTASILALYDTIAVAIQQIYVENKSFTWGDFEELYEYNLFVNLAFGSFIAPIEHYAEESKIYLKLRAYMQNHKNLPDGWQSWSREAREHFLKEAKFFSGFADGSTIQSIILNIVLEFGKDFNEEQAKQEVVNK